MTKEQFFTFKSDMKKGMRIQKLSNSHRKAYWNEGFATKEDQKKAINKDVDEITSIKETIALRKHKQKWVSEGDWYWKGHYEDTDETYPIVLGESPNSHWTYYIAKHKLEGEDIISYISGELNRLTDRKKEWYTYPTITADKVFEKYVKPILDEYEKIVCTD